ncbi:MAG: class I SAM-dependent DNA methyltransferase, partial [Chloroflexi bacterium]|nr:class I SAM-dependent DNA methyltransferase [Chloroflexota bacterium]
MPDLLQTIETHLNTPRLRDNLTPLFCETLLWGRLQGQPRSLQAGAPIDRAVPLTPVAQLSGLPVFRVDWPYPKLPTVTQRRAVHHALAPTHLEHLLAYVTDDGRQATFVWARRRPQNKIELRALPYAVGSPARTTIEQLGELAFTFQELGLFGEPSILAVMDKLNAAFNVEAVTKRFFTAYRDVFREVEKQISGVNGDARRLFTQKLFNRLMFLVFLERKGWLTFNGHQDYLHALWEDYWRERQTTPDTNFYRDRLKLLFFAGLNTPHEVNIVGIRRDGFLQTRIGDVPYLNGGLFEEDEEDRNPAITVPDEAIRPVLDKLFYRFNFTVTESTPLDVEVAVDAEMLGKVFEELVTGRHETGSYYTPKPVVAFMGRQALKGYLQTACPTESTPAIAAFVDEHNPAGLRAPGAVLEARKTVHVCDPACGSGAYLLGMLHELLDLRACLFATRGLDPLTTYQRKLEIIQNNVYGVDIDPFAVNIARLRLWLSLVVDFEDGTPPPLPNLDFKIEVGDSLTAPDPSGGLGTGFRKELVERSFRVKADYLMAHGGEKLTFREEIERLRADITAWAGRPAGTTGFDWVIEFAEVFSPSPSQER